MRSRHSLAYLLVRCVMFLALLALGGTIANQPTPIQASEARRLVKPLANSATFATLGARIGILPTAPLVGRMTEDPRACWWYDDPPEGCISEGLSSGAGGEDDPENFPYPTYIEVWGVINGHTVAGNAIRIGSSSAYNVYVGGGSCTAHIVLDLSPGEAMLVWLGNTVIFESWFIAGSSGCG